MLFHCLRWKPNILLSLLDVLNCCEQNTFCLNLAGYMCLYFCDNTSAINLSSNPIQHIRTRHIDIKYYFIHDLAQRGETCIDYICSNDQIPDIFTKVLPLDQSVY